MTIYNKNGSLAVTIVQRLTTQIMQTMNSTSASNEASDDTSVIQLDDEDEFAVRDKWETVRTTAKIMYDVNVAAAVIQSVVGLVLLLTILDRKVREKSQIWYLYHLIVLSVFVGLVLHPVSHDGKIYRHRQACFFVMYGAEYAFFGVGMNVVLVNIEIFFTKIFTIQKWESNPFTRFLVLILSGWLVVCFLIAHVVISNNAAKSEGFCFYIKDKSVRKMRFVFRAIIPAVICFLFTVVSVVIYALKRSRITFTTTTGELKEIRTEGRDDEAQWLRCAIFMNVVYIVREVAMMIVFFNSTVGGPDHYMWIIFIVFIHVQALYLIPFCAFFVADVRLALKNIAKKFIEKVTMGKVRLGDDLENLSISFGNMSQSDNS